ncbi:3-hydroxyisobutyrate dehydrogenase related protein [Dinoroseobacter shibae DFL 12 = DSM 16493]|jgi:3-hydroxyisobutyrate dehydrogenase-like beta-hydroxyacid dehydrogenase|uniref:3-hydroxyisobutyrate dehydrogenase related protein n=1 Tax=Dinoroseobacter shibae (strain DSM 16493 / NCIMB 14021 / DFL 12) TaxID=398580 RepID=A8LS84_DINSH|nr:NAD(P)-dependent oxidoreductase [Dinoroseobacter shibae]ABV94177.1 3-hydroxyisobutyrate dehydrogenase related protein [Dinoroseobacter shibae DFL 12 = DSM 16493]URF45618.1 NAD(P)-dependent oxidoreductase [Dinoroseobacter shibae]URF49923.1 NAD(P)-dependent oxidoreductase [Dinoroseobacter shibae]
MSLPAVGFIGVGMMGAGMAGCLLSAGHPVTLLAHRNRAPLTPLLDRGAREAPDAVTLLDGCDVLFTCLPDAEAVAGLADTLLPHTRPGQIWIDTTTSRPETSATLAHRLDAAGAVFSDAPVTGGPKQAQDGALTSLVGCAAAQFDTIASLVGTYSTAIRRFGDAGTGHAAKLLNNLVTQGTMVLLSDAFQAAGRLGVDPRALYEVMMTGAARSGTLQKAVPPALDGDYTGARFSISNAAKDLGYAEALLADALPGRADVAGALAARLGALAAQGRGAEFVTTLFDPNRP